MSTTATGQLAETAAAEYLTRQGYVIRDRNWRNRWCEIDIVAEKDGCLHFVEVKYRGHDSQGSGLEHITPAKLRRMRFAADFYVSEKSWNGDMNLAAVEVSSPDNAIADFVPSINLDY
jgi:putative endonuclease